MKIRYGFLTLAVCLSGQLHAQTVRTLVCFDDTNGAYPIAPLTLDSDGNFYGTADNGGTNYEGTVFRVTANGTLTTLVTFNGSNGVDPAAGLTLGSDGNFYGITYEGPGNGGGTVYELATDGTLTTLSSFNINTGMYPYAALALGEDGNLYGTTTVGGNTNLNGGGGFGTIFRATTNGNLIALVFFGETNGWHPEGGLTLGCDGNFYGATELGGSGAGSGGVAYGTVFKMATNGMLTTLVSFTGTNGAYPVGGLTQGNDGNFYGTTSGGGSNNDGTVFVVSTNGALTTLACFTGANGAGPEAALTLGNDGNFYGTTANGGSTNSAFPNGMGTIFKMSTNGILTTLIYFDGRDGAVPVAPMTLGGNDDLYGTTFTGGSTNLNGGSGYGTVFHLSLAPNIPPKLTLQVLSGYPLLSLYGTLGDSYRIEYTTNLVIPDWKALLIIPNVSLSPFQLIDPSGMGQPARFYRAVQSQ